MAKTKKKIRVKEPLFFSWLTKFQVSTTIRTMFLAICSKQTKIEVLILNKEGFWVSYRDIVYVLSCFKTAPIFSILTKHFFEDFIGDYTTFQLLIGWKQQQFLLLVVYVLTVI